MLYFAPEDTMTLATPTGNVMACGMFRYVSTCSVDASPEYKTPRLSLFSNQPLHSHSHRRDFTMKFSQTICPLVHLLGVVYAVSIDDCPGYEASNVKTTDGGLTADLSLAGEACNFLGYDVGKLKLVVESQGGKSLRTIISSCPDTVRYKTTRQDLRL